MTFAGENPRVMRRRIAVVSVVVALGANAVLLLTEPGLALPRALGSYFFGSKLVRADVVVRDGGIREFRLDRGRVVRIGPARLVVREADRTVVVVPVAPVATVLLNGRAAVLGDLAPGMIVTTIREGADAASEIRAHGR